MSRTPLLTFGQPLSIKTCNDLLNLISTDHPQGGILRIWECQQRGGLPLQTFSEEVILADKVLPQTSSSDHKHRRRRVCSEGAAYFQGLLDMHR